MYPLRPKPTILVAKTAVALIWALAVLIMSPAAVVLTVEQVPFHYMVHNNDFNNTMPLYTCYEDFANPRMRRVYTVVLFVHIYLAPLAIIAFMYGSIGVKLFTSVLANREAQVPNGTVQAGARRGRQPVISQKKIMVIKMLILVTLVFMLSWLPLWILMMMADYAGLDRDQLDLLTSYIFPFAHWLAFSNSSVNPIIYGYYNENLQRGLQAVCRSKPFCCLMHCQFWSRMTRWGRKHRSVQVPCRREANTNHTHIVLGVRNRVHNTDKFIDPAQGNRASRVSCVVVHSERGISDQGVEMAVIQKNGSNNQESQQASCLAASVHNAWQD